MSMIDPESLMFSIPRFCLPFDYFKTLHETRKERERREKMQRMTEALKQNFKEMAERAIYKAFAAEFKEDVWNGTWCD